MWHPVTSGVFPPGCVRLDAAEKSDRSVVVSQRAAESFKPWKLEHREEEEGSSEVTAGGEPLIFHLLVRSWTQLC